MGPAAGWCVRNRGPGRFLRAQRVRVTGVVQGVGFRPYVWVLARRYALSGWVRNNASGVDIAIEGADEDVDRFLNALRGGGPPRAQVHSVDAEPTASPGCAGFEIRASRNEPDAALPVSADLATCDACLAEMRDPDDRRYRYPFLNCTDCGPRYTIVRDIPYDRSRTTMGAFSMCDACRREYEDPADRRFHAQPVACPACGPHAWLEVGDARGPERGDAIAETRARLARGEIVAVKGLGGFHLACDATNATAVARLRERKHREEKPLALMSRDRVTVERFAAVSECAAGLLESVARPVVLLPARAGSAIAEAVAPGRREHGFMLAYTPLHHLLLEPAPDAPDVLVMTSANLTDEPIVYRNADARARLGTVADAILLHDRSIHVRADDSVVAEYRGRPYPFRRARGYAPLPVRLPFDGPHVLAFGGDLKNTFCVTRGDQALLGHHIGDLEHYENTRALDEAIDHYERLFRVTPAVIAHDLHPDYQATRRALERATRDACPAIAVQHHHAHVAAVMAEHGLPRGSRVIGVAFDGTGYGMDGTIWGGEFLVAGYAGFERAAHLDPVPLPGGDAAVTRPYRTALGCLWHAGIEWTPDLAPVRAASDDERALLASQLRANVNVPRSSGAGRLFDAVSALLGVCQRSSYEAQAASELEAIATREETGGYAFAIRDGVVDPVPALRAVVEDIRRGVPTPNAAARWHRGTAMMVRTVCGRLRETHQLGRVALTGGVWQNRLLLGLAADGLVEDGFEVLVHEHVPANDGGLALGQAVVAIEAMRGREG
ncbi:MAG: carbamoyltransferase HypF [Phycisphaerales bacterium]|nr:carbamoyltransferase HypF [Phycisphaerales bacterium]